MSDEVNGQAPETTDDVTPEVTSPQPTPDNPQDSWLDTLEPEAKKEILKLRKEAASRRVLTREQEQQLDEYKKWKESQMTELEKAQAKITELEKANKEVTRVKVARDVGLDLDLVDFIKGDSEDEMLESAKVLAEKLGGANPGGQRPPTPSPDMFAGRRGPAVTDEEADKKKRANEFMVELLNRAK